MAFFGFFYSALYYPARLYFNGEVETLTVSQIQIIPSRTTSDGYYISEQSNAYFQEIDYSVVIPPNLTPLVKKGTKLYVWKNDKAEYGVILKNKVPTFSDLERPGWFISLIGLILLSVNLLLLVCIGIQLLIAHSGDIDPLFRDTDPL